ncbi:T9SS type A sorting domain-containing protein [Pedobacter xixiisoli]|uniref:Por secretion system C-terminal sorting domain-containing protein n=1 Tax=Pedobacter xixiisoli TaxID=1476464 RepID=A0A286ADW6_9SPHI|nr:T9SS type A sorting domain-containing protein [Pedobacter xixiisoli]SOD20102.1 Por secretion system C-terminal sorting domain-containing protein [Pedobacter xixiisoli]
MNFLYRISFALFFAVFIVFPSNAQQLAFPTAQGFGKFATGGRGGKVYTVTNLNDAGAGSFREAFNAYPGEPLTIVFAVGGTIELQSQIKVNRSNFTIAGQTAPGDGICLKGHSFIINGARAANLGGNHGNIIIRYLRSRPGSTLPTGVYGFDLENCHNVIVDHCSFSWANEECAAMYDMENVTVQYSMVSEGLFNAGHAKGNRGYGGVWGGQYVSYHHNLFAHLNARSTRFNGARAHDVNALVDYRNNVIYNAGTRNAAAGGAVNIENSFSRINLVNNYYKPGPATPSDYLFIEADYEAAEAKGVGEFHVSGNVMHGNSAKTNDNWSAVSLTKIPANLQADAQSSVPFVVAQSIMTQSADDAYLDVLKNAGANLPVRDAVDRRVVSETSTGTASTVGITSGKRGIIDLPNEVGGWPAYNSGTALVDTDGDGMPDTWEQNNGLNANDAADGNTVNDQGYTMLEVYLNGISASVASTYELMGFAATLNSGSTTTATLNWVINNDVDLQNFIIERSADGQNFNTITTVNSQKGAGLNNYTYTDNNPLAFTSYYRLKLVATNNQVNYSDNKIISNPIAQAYWMEPFTNTTVTSIAKPATIENSIQDNGTWILYGAQREEKSVSDVDANNQWTNGVSNPSLKILNRNAGTTTDYTLTEDPYVITPIFNQGISKITFYENQRASINANSIKIYTSTNGGQTWSTTAISSAAKSLKFDLITVPIEGANINRLKITKPAGVTMNIDNLTIYAPVGTTLPLDFVSFSATLKKSLNHKTVLLWKTANEVNTAYFEILRSINGKDFSRIGGLSAVNQPGTHIYEFEDEKLLTGVSYYRIKQVDLDGKYTYSEIRSVNNRLEGQLNFYPNPVTKELTLNHPAAGVGTSLNLYDISGRLVATKTVAADLTQSKVSLQHLPQGIYLLKYKTTTEVISLKVIKQ